MPAFKIRKSLIVFPSLVLALGIGTAEAKDKADNRDCSRPDPVGRVISGPENARLTIEEFVDFQCSFCARGSNAMKEVLRDFPGKIRLILRPVALPFHLPTSLTASRAFGAIWLQDPALANAFQGELFARQDRLKNEGSAFIDEVAAKIGADVEKMKAEMNGETVNGFIEDDRRKMEAHGIQGTPSFLIGSELVVGARPYHELKKIVEKELESKK